MNASNHIPVELTELILQHVQCTYKRHERPIALYECALVCRTWRFIAQRLIFSEIVRQPNPQPTQPFPGNEKLRSLVLRVWIIDFSRAGVASLLDTLPNLKELLILHPYFATFAGLWKTFKKDRLVLNKLTSFSLSKILVPIRLFRSCSSLQELKLDRCDLDIQSLHGAIDAPPQRVQLRLLHIRACSQALLTELVNPRMGLDLTRLTTLHIFDIFQGFHLYNGATWKNNLIPNLVTGCAATIQDLVIPFPPEYASPGPHAHAFNASQLLNLRVIRLPITQQLTTFIDYLPWLSTFFSSFHTNSGLEEIFIPCKFDDYYIHILSCKDYDLARFEWARLDDVLSSGIRALRRVVISLNKSEPTTSPLKELGPELRELLPRLMEKGMLEIEESTEYEYMSYDYSWWDAPPPSLARMPRRHPPAFFHG